MQIMIENMLEFLSDYEKLPINILLICTLIHLLF